MPRAGFEPTTPRSRESLSVSIFKFCICLSLLSYIKKRNNSIRSLNLRALKMLDLKTLVVDNKDNRVYMSRNYRPGGLKLFKRNTNVSQLLEISQTPKQKSLILVCSSPLLAVQSKYAKPKQTIKLRRETLNRHNRSCLSVLLKGWISLPIRWSLKKHDSYYPADIAIQSWCCWSIYSVIVKKISWAFSFPLM